MKCPKCGGILDDSDCSLSCVCRKTTITGRRGEFVDVPYTWLERARIKWADIVRPVPKTHGEIEWFDETDPRFKNALLEETYVWI